MGYLGRLLVALTGVSLVVWLMGRFVYYRSWLAATEVQTVRGKGHVLLDSSKMGFGRPLLHNGQMDVIVKRDFWMFIRDPGQWVHLLLMFLLLGAFLFSLSTLDTATDHPFMRTVSFLSLLLFDGFLLSSMALRFVFPAVSLEGESFWCVRSAPVDLRTLYHEKFLGAFLLLLLTSQILAAVSVGLAHQPIPLIIAATLAMSAEAFAFAGLHLSTGARFALFREKSPVRVASSHGATLTFLMSMAYLALVTIVLAGPVQRYFEECTSTSTGSAYLVLLPVGIVVVLSLVIGVIANHYGTRDFVRGI
jgi:ABC-2 type transport system permease protein